MEFKKGDKVKLTCTVIGKVEVDAQMQAPQKKVESYFGEPRKDSKVKVCLKDGTVIDVFADEIEN